jgi:hypothetical protein
VKLKGRVDNSLKTGGREKTAVAVFAGMPGRPACDQGTLKKTKLDRPSGMR